MKQAALWNLAQMMLFGSSVIQRYFTEFLSSVNSYGESTDTITLNGDFDIEFDAVFNLSGNQTVLGGNTVVNDIVVFGSASFDPGRLRLVIDSVNADFTGFIGGVTNKLDKVRIKRTGGTIEAFLNGVSKGTQSNSGTLTIDQLARRDVGNYFDGFLANLKIHDQGTLVLDSPMDDKPDSPYFVNKAAVLGSELFNAPSLSSNWSDNGGGSYTSDGSVQGDLFVPGVTTVGNSYLYEINVESITSGTIRLRVGDTTGSFYDITSAGSYSVPLEAAIVDTTVRALVGTVATVSGISLREIPATTPYIIKQNISQDQTELFDQVADGWTGEELWTFGEYTTAGSEAQNEVLLGVASGALSVGSVYLTDGRSEVASADIRLLVASDTVRPNDWPDVSVPAANTRLQLQYTSATPPPAGQKVTGITVKRLLQEAT